MMSGEEINPLEGPIKVKIQLISVDDFIAACRKAFNDKQSAQRVDADELLKPSKSDSKNTERSAWLKKLFNQLKNNHITCLDALTACLIKVPGGDGPHSFKHGLLYQLFGDELNKFAFRDQNVVVQATAMLRSWWENEKREKIAAIVEDLKKINKDQFTDAYQAVHEYRKSINKIKSRETKASIVNYVGVVSNVVTPIYKFGKFIKNKSREIGNNAIKQQVDEDRLSIFDAIYACLTTFIGQNGPDSFKYSFLFSLYGCTYNDNGWNIPVANDTAYFLRRVYCLKGVGEVLDELVRCMYVEIESKKTAKIKWIRECLDAFNQLGEAETRNKFEQAISAAKKEKAHESGFFKTITKNAVRDKEIDGILDMLNKGDITAKKALYLCLQLNVGQEGRNSFKYKLLKHLFNLNEEATEIHNTVNCFIEVLSGAAPMLRPGESLLVSHGNDEDQSPRQNGSDLASGDEEDQLISPDADLSSDDESSDASLGQRLNQYLY